MGRPPLHKSGTVGIHLKVSKELRKRIKAALGEDETESKFMRKAAELLLTRRERKTKEKGK